MAKRVNTAKKAATKKESEERSTHEGTLSTKICRDCRIRIDARAVRCRECGAWQDLFRNKFSRSLPFIVTLITVVAVLCCELRSRRQFATSITADLRLTRIDWEWTWTGELGKGQGILDLAVCNHGGIEGVVYNIKITDATGNHAVTPKLRSLGRQQSLIGANNDSAVVEGGVIGSCVTVPPKASRAFSLFFEGFGREYSNGIKVEFSTVKYEGKRWSGISRSYRHTETLNPHVSVD